MTTTRVERREIGLKILVSTRILALIGTVKERFQNNFIYPKERATMAQDNPHLQEFNEQLQIYVQQSSVNNLTLLKMVAAFKRAVATDIELQFLLSSIGGAVFTLDFKRAATLAPELMNLIDVEAIQTLATQMGEMLGGEQSDLMEEIMEEDEDEQT